MGAEYPRNEYVQAFERGLAVISSFDGSALTLSEVAQRVKMSPAAARRYLSTLTELGYFAHRNGRFAAQAKLLELSNPYFAANDSTLRAESALKELTRQLNETSTLTQLEGSEVVNVLAVTSKRELSIQVAPGRKLPAYCTAMGRAMLSLLSTDEVKAILKETHLERHTINTRIRREDIMEQIQLAADRGYALVEEEHTPGIRTMSIAFRLPQQQLAAISAPTPTARETRQEYIARVETPLKEAVASMN
ncbi:IclR family transcriptional regulator [Arthrobacter cryoconiti]|uniref:IclR family transcriptional regulator n=1 Tax=Arthrobacter cryoconiti TaxID=748907 RepID=A0ABV8R0P8_9MICC|nr:IclR family transcriptional regulator C-terminal domain-containing protein [Arthrobacter cryoconiti]MCC9068574.1 helix-turn-helix domain-containing protein [Arthrobacter cryoconiti]